MSYLIVNKLNIYLFFNCSEDLKRNEHHVVQLVFDSFYHFYLNDSSKLSPLYPYDSTKIVVILFYGNDFLRLLVTPALLDIISIGEHWLLFVWFALSILATYLIRSIIGIQKINFFYSSVWNMIIVWIGGGNLQYNHKFENIFLAIMLFATFFIRSFGVGNFNSNIVSQGSNVIDTFQELAKTKDLPVYLSHVLQDKKDTVLKLLGSVFFL